MAYSTITKPSLHFNTVLYSGDDATTRNITGFGFQPDFIWNKARSASYNHYLIDAVRGSPGKTLISNLTNAEDSDSGFQNSFKGFVADGNTIGQVSGYEVNDSGVDYVQWGWKANGAGSANTDGSINSTVSVNQTAGFSIVKYTGTGSGATIGHGLNSELGMLIVKKFESGGQAGNWTIWHKGLTSPQHDEVIFLNSTGAEADVSNDTYWNGANPTSSVFSVNTNENLNENTYDYIAYCFAEKKGYSKFGTYTGNGNANGTFIYTGFKPRWTLIKPISTTGNWQIHDTKRDGYNVKNDNLAPNNNSPEADNQFMDILSNGFKLRSATYSANGVSYIYMAIAEEPLVANVGASIPATAR